MLPLTIFLILLVFSLYLLIRSRNNHNEFVDSLDKKAFPLKAFFPMALHIMDGFGQGLIARLNKKKYPQMIELYGERKAKLQLRLHWANTITWLLVSSLILSLMGAALALDIGGAEEPAVSVRADGTIDRPAPQEGNRQVTLSARIRKGDYAAEETMDVVVKRQEMDNALAVARTKERLSVPLILGENESLSEVRKPLNLPERNRILGVEIGWFSSDFTVLTEDGSVYQKSPGMGDVPVTLTAILKKGEATEEVVFQLTVKEMTEAEEIAAYRERLRESIMAGDEAYYSADALLLPSTIGDEGDPAQVSWRAETQTGNRWGINPEFLIFTLLVIGGLGFATQNDLRQKIGQRHMQLRLDFPDFISKFVLLINAGMSVSKAWEKVANDGNKDRPLYMELSHTLSEIRGGKSQYEAYEDFAKRCKIPEISRFVAVIVQNLRKGNEEMVTLLRLQASETWEMRKNAAKKVGEEASTKLLFPMMIMLLAILLIILTPAVLSLLSM